MDWQYQVYITIYEFVRLSECVNDVCEKQFNANVHAMLQDPIWSISSVVTVEKR